MFSLAAFSQLYDKPFEDSFPPAPPSHSDCGPWVVTWLPLCQTAIIIKGSDWSFCPGLSCLQCCPVELFYRNSGVSARRDHSRLLGGDKIRGRPWEGNRSLSSGLGSITHMYMETWVGRAIWGQWETTAVGMVGIWRGVEKAENFKY